MNKKWLIYGAYGYTGKLLAEEAVRKGYNPVLAGRSSEKLLPIAEELKLDYLIFNLQDEKNIIENIRDFDLILLAAGPFKYTSSLVVNACLKTGTHYMDITGEVPIFEQNFKLNKQAKEQGILILSGVGFDVVPTDCMAKYVSEKIKNPTHLELGITGLGSSSPGTLKTMIEYMDTGLLIRRDGRLIQKHPNKVLKKIRFVDKEREVKPIVWGDLSTAYRTTNIPNITTYMPFPKQLVNLLKSTEFSKKDSLRNKSTLKKNFKKIVQQRIEKNVKGPDESARQKGRSYVWARVKNDKGSEAQAWLETIESYQFTAISGIKCIEKQFKLKLDGTLTPAIAFGKDFILEFPKTKRYDSI